MTEVSATNADYSRLRKCHPFKTFARIATFPYTYAFLRTKCTYVSFFVQIIVDEEAGNKKK